MLSSQSHPAVPKVSVGWARNVESASHTVKPPSAKPDRLIRCRLVQMEKLNDDGAIHLLYSLR